MMLNSAIFLSVLLPFALAQGVNQRVVLYEERNQGGQYVIVPETYVPDLQTINFDNRANSFCINAGTWIFYINPNYNTDASGGVEYAFGQNYCRNFATVGGYISSVRFAGSPTDYRADSFTIYEEDYFQGEEEYSFTSLPSINLKGSHKSIIITGSGSWRIFDEEDYNGSSICLTPPGSGTDYTPLFIPDLNSLNVPYGSIRSIRKGC